MNRLPQLLLTIPLVAVGALRAQNVTTVPPIAATLPGNAAVSLPLRWSQGVMQVRIDASLLPNNFIGQTITGLRLRKPSALFEPAYAALSRTLTVRGCFHGGTAAQASSTLLTNRPANLASLFGPTAVAVSATAATGPASAVGEQLVEIMFAAPLLVTAGNLFLEFEASGSTFSVSADHWVDAVWVEGATEDGYAVPVGDGSCTTRTERTELAWTSSQGPRVGQTSTLRLTGAPPTIPNTTQVGFALVWFGVDPLARAASTSYMGYGGSLASLSPAFAGCHQWAPLDYSWGGLTDLAGGFDVSLNLTAGTFSGMRLGVQAGWLDLARPGFPLSVSNGMALVLDTTGVGNRCSTVFFPPGTAVSPWPVDLGLMPVVTLLH